MHLESFENFRKQTSYLPRKTYRIKWESLADKEVRTAFARDIASAVSSKNFPPLLKTLKLSGVCFEQQSLRLLLTVADVSVFEEVKSSEKRTPWWKQEVKEAIRAKKVACKAWLANKSSLELRLQYSEARKAAATKVNLSNEDIEKEFEKRIDKDFKIANVAFWLTIRRLLRKRSQAAF